MKDKILRQMEAIVNKTMKSFQTDFFNYDKPRIASPEFKFPAIWIVGESHTHLLELGNYQDSFFEFESVRFDFLRQTNPYQHYFNESCYAKDKWILVTEDFLSTVNKSQAESAIMGYVMPTVNAWIHKNGPLPKLTKIPIRFKDIALSELKALIADCRAHHNDCLVECFKMWHRSCRVAADQHTEISYQKHWNEFIFREYINGEERLAGHIVFHDWPETGYQTNGAIQLVPLYGWGSHT